MQYLCISALSCTSEPVFGPSGLVCGPRCIKLTEEQIDTLVFLVMDLEVFKELSRIREKKTCSVFETICMSLNIAQ